MPCHAASKRLTNLMKSDHCFSPQKPNDAKENKISICFVSSTEENFMARGEMKNIQINTNTQRKKIK